MIDDWDSEQTPQRAAQVRDRGWRERDENLRWRIELPERIRRPPAEIARIVIADVRVRGDVSGRVDRAGH